MLRNYNRNAQEVIRSAWRGFPEKPLVYPYMGNSSRSQGRYNTTYILSYFVFRIHHTQTPVAAWRAYCTWTTKFPMRTVWCTYSQRLSAHEDAIHLHLTSSVLVIIIILYSYIIFWFLGECHRMKMCLYGCIDTTDEIIFLIFLQHYAVAASAA